MDSPFTLLPAGGGAAPLPPRRAVYWLQGVTLAWMTVECAVSLSAAVRAHSVALAAFGSDSLVELLSAGVVLAAVLPGFRLSQTRAAQWAGQLLFVLAGVVTLLAVITALGGVNADTSFAGMAITGTALIAMPVLAALKRRNARATGNRALAADAAQSATCAYLAAVTLAGLAATAVFQARWFDPIAALIAVPILVIEGRRARRGQSCACCATH